ncbi:lignin-forming anionic peroxidase-like [Magnolia sinica]|uniref:lignin-forming anionic peroxidase-like n=1 Tax=Magnolia sinica TaxID=86752 RepID=UPI0026583F0C|nr:lignin-forming anionic peroxidase-like [Magnolia sinica]
MGFLVVKPTRVFCVYLACFLVTMLSLVSNGSCHAKLSSTFYDKACPNALSTIQSAVRTAISRERRMAGSLIRLHFHDCFVQGCDGSLLLEDTSSFTGERGAFQNSGSVRGFEVVDEVKSRVENVCPGVVSCADILAVAARDASVAVGGPTWKVKLGRRDSRTASKSQAESNIPRASDDLSVLISLFKRKGLNAKEMVALSGSHTIGQAQCITFRNRIYNETDIDAGFASTRRRGCPSNGGDANLAPIDLVTPNSFDNNYYKNLIKRKGLLKTDQVLFSGSSTNNFVTKYSNDQAAFYSDFAAAMVKMGDIDPLTGSSGEIRRRCKSIN